MLSKTLEKALNKQINREYYSAFLYLSMASHFENINMLGMASWMKMQYEEEVMHAIKIFDMIIDMEGRVVLKQVDGPPTNFDSALSVFEQTLNHERNVTKMINDIYSLARKESNYAVQSALQWFIDEQVSRARPASRIINFFRILSSLKK